MLIKLNILENSQWLPYSSRQKRNNRIKSYLSLYFLPCFPILFPFFSSNNMLTFCSWKSVWVLPQKQELRYRDKSISHLIRVGTSQKYSLLQLSHREVPGLCSATFSPVYERLPFCLLFKVVNINLKVDV